MEQSHHVVAGPGILEVAVGEMIIPVAVGQMASLGSMAKEVLVVTMEMVVLEVDLTSQAFRWNISL